MPDDRRVDLLYLACNRLAFTQETFAALLANTDWDHVRELVVMDDGSVDGTREWLAGAVGQAPVPVRFRRTRFGSPVAAMVSFVEGARAPILAKTDNDAILPPGWLGQGLAVLDRHPELALLGIEAIHPVQAAPEIPRSYVPAEFVSGLGLYRRAAFARGRPVPHERWFGFEAWQAAQGPRLVRGWIAPALPVFLLDRVPVEPWAGLTADYVRRGWQRPWPPYDRADDLWSWHQRQPAPAGSATVAPPATVPLPAPTPAEGDPRFLCAMRVKNEATHIGEALARALALCRRAFVFDDHSTDETPAICASFGERVTVFPSPFAGLDEVRDKNHLLREVIAAAPEWVLWIDGDEVLERSGPERLRRAAAAGRTVAAYSLRVAYLWDDPGLVRADGIFGRFTRPSFFRLRGQRPDRLRFVPSGFGGNFHCGNVPHGLAGEVRPLDVRLKHYGYVSREARQAKYVWYTSRDPNNAAEDHYRHLAEVPGARYAPGPPQLVPWTE